MLTLIGQVVKVAAGKAGKDKDTGEIIEAVPVVFVQHSTSTDANSDVAIEKIKLKDAAQVAAFQKAIGQNVQVPVRVWFQGAKSGFWLESGVLPTVVQPKAA